MLGSENSWLKKSRTWPVVWCKSDSGGGHTTIQQLSPEEHFAEACQSLDTTIDKGIDHHKILFDSGGLQQRPGMRWLRSLISSYEFVLGDPGIWDGDHYNPVMYILRQLLLPCVLGLCLQKNPRFPDFTIRATRRKEPPGVDFWPTHQVSLMKLRNQSKLHFHVGYHIYEGSRRKTQSKRYVQMYNIVL